MSCAENKDEVFLCGSGDDQEQRKSGVDIMQKIDLENRNELFRGCVAPGIRMNEKLIEFYTEPAVRLIRARSASGVRVAMVTDAVEMEYSLVFGESARTIYTSDIIVDGKLTTVEGEGVHRMTFAPGEKEIIIHLPHLVIVEKIEIALNDGATVKAAPVKAKKILVCGDSILQGMTCTTPTKAVGTMLGEALGMEYHNTSVGGADMRWEPVGETIRIGGDVIVIGFGINDVFHKTPIEEFRMQTVKTLELLSDFKGKSFMIVPIPNLNPGCEKREEYCQIIRDELKRFPAVAGIEGAEFYPADAEYFADGTHPNDKGMAVYAENLARIIREHL